MKILFWMCALFIAYTYIGYPMLLWLISRFRSRPFVRKRFAPTVSIIMAVRNEEKELPAKLNNLWNLDYPRDRVQIIVVSDGSSDGTVDILRQYGDKLHSVILEKASGKAVALNQAAKCASGEILLFTDVRQILDPNAISELTASFYDPDIGAVSGELILEGGTGSPLNGLTTYWNIEKIIRRLESTSGSVIGTTGALYAVRRRLYDEIPSGTI